MSECRHTGHSVFLLIAILQVYPNSQHAHTLKNLLKATSKTIFFQLPIRTWPTKEEIIIIANNLSILFILSILVLEIFGVICCYEHYSFFLCLGQIRPARWKGQKKRNICPLMPSSGNPNKSHVVSNYSCLLVMYNETVL